MTSNDTRLRRWRRARRIAVRTLATTAGALLLAATARAGGPAAVEVPCAGVPATVSTARPDTAALACAGVADAFAFLHWLAPEPGEHLRVELVEALPPGLRRDAVGCFAVKSRRLQVLELPLFLRRGTWFRVPVSGPLWRSVVAHEAAHALVGCHLQGRPLPGAAHEYVAYVAMFATMDPALRQAALAAMPGTGFDHDAQINDLGYALDPMRFGVESYRHWLRQPDGDAFLRSIVRGSIVPELPP